MEKARGQRGEAKKKKKWEVRDPIAKNGLVFQSCITFIFIYLFHISRRAITFVFRIRKLWTFLPYHVRNRFVHFVFRFCRLYHAKPCLLWTSSSSLSDLLLNIQPPKIAHILFTLLFIRVFVLSELFPLSPFP